MMTTPDTVNLRTYRQAISYFAIGQAGFLCSLIICVLLLPKGLLANHGFSYYGDYTRTMLPYHLAFAVCGVCTLLASFSLPSAMPFKLIKYAFRLIPVLLLGIAVTTAPHSPTLDNIHRPIGVTLFVLQFALGTWLACIAGKDRLNLLLLPLLIGSGLVSLLALCAIIHCLLEGQVLFQFAFAMLIIRGLNRLGAQT